MKKFTIEYVQSNKSVVPLWSSDHISDAIKAFELAYEDAYTTDVETRPEVVRLVNIMNGQELAHRKISE